MAGHKSDNFFCWLSLIFISTAWHFPGQWPCAVLSWIGCLLLAIYLPKVKSPYSVLYSAGIFLYSIGFYWLFYTIRDFGGFNNFISLLIFLLFVTVSAIQFIILVFVWKNLPDFFKNNSFAIACAWFCAELLSIKIFPWCLGHSQLAATYIAQFGEISGAPGVSFLMIWFCECLYQLFKSKKLQISTAICFIVFTANLIFGYTRSELFSNETFPKQNVTLVQANISLEDKHDIRLPQFNLERHMTLSRQFADKETIIVWPESAATEFIPANIKNAREDVRKRVPYFDKSPLLFGGLTYESREKFYNSAIGVSADGNISGIYHKQILMPFGEYTPFSKTLPWLKDINSTAGEFSAGDKIEVIELNTINGKPVKISPLICYEDIIPELSAQAVKAGAEILVNLTNDAWFGNTIAPYQHNLIASFRAIENRRYLLRATNTGLTAIVNPLGKTVESLTPYTEGIITRDIEKINFRALSSYYDMPYILRILALFFLLIAAVRRILYAAR